MEGGVSGPGERQERGCETKEQQREEVGTGTGDRAGGVLFPTRSAGLSTVSALYSVKWGAVEGFSRGSRFDPI